VCTDDFFPALQCGTLLVRRLNVGCEWRTKKTGSSGWNTRTLFSISPWWRFATSASLTRGLECTTWTTESAWRSTPFTGSGGTLILLVVTFSLVISRRVFNARNEHLEIRFDLLFRHLPRQPEDVVGHQRAQPSHPGAAAEAQTSTKSRRSSSELANWIQCFHGILKHL
jgi:hypothetical protein